MAKGRGPVWIIMGSDSDLPFCEPGLKIFEHFGIDWQVRVASAHRTPDRVVQLCQAAEKGEAKVIIGAAGGAAHLPGVIASMTTVPVIGLPIPTGLSGGMDSLLSIVQMPSGIPVMTVSVGGGKNAALAAVTILAVSDVELKKDLIAYRKDMARVVEGKDAAVQKKLCP